MMGSGSTWFMDAAALGGWTAKGTAKVLQDRISTLPADQRPQWMEGLGPQKIEEMLTKVIVDVVEASHVIQGYMDGERSKGRDFEDIYSEVKPYLDHVGRPIEQDIRDGHFNEVSPEEPGAAAAAGEPDLEAQAAMREYEKQLAPHRTLAARPLEQSAGLRASVPQESAAEGQAPPQRRAREPVPPDAVRDEDASEPLLLVGSCNSWTAELALDTHRFEPAAPRADGASESVLRVRVPAAGLFFQVLSAAQLWQWRLFPGRRSTVKLGEAAAVPASLGYGPDADDKARGRDFRIKAVEGLSVVDVHVAISAADGARVWYTDPDAEPLPALGDAS